MVCRNCSRPEVLNWSFLLCKTLKKIRFPLGWQQNKKKLPNFRARRSPQFGSPGKITWSTWLCAPAAMNSHFRHSSSQPQFRSLLHNSRVAASEQHSSYQSKTFRANYSFSLCRTLNLFVRLARTGRDKVFSLSLRHVTPCL